MESSPSETQPCPLQFYEFQQLDHQQHCPVYSTILDRPDDTISADDLDSLQTDLQALQTSMQRRIQLLESELVVLNDWQVKRDYNRKRKLSDVSETGHRPSTTTKRQKTESEPTPPPRHTKKSKTHPTESVMEPHSSKFKSKGKGDAPDRFWATVEPYCADITDTDISLLQEDLKNTEGEGDLYRIPSLGQHYSRYWAMEDLEEERREGGRAMENMDTGNRGSAGNWKTESESLLKQAESLNRGESKSGRAHCPLTERLMAAFLEDPQAEKSSPPLPSQRRSSHILSAPPSRALEERIKDELTLLGLLEPPEGREEREEEDEILLDLNRKQAELKAVTEFNRQQLQTLVTLARGEMERQDLRKEAQEADEEVMEVLRRFVSARQKKRSVGRKEKEAAWKALERREHLYQRLDQM